MNNIKTYQQNLKREILTYYGKGKCQCVVCGYNDINALSIDHINGDGAQHRKTVKNIYYWVKRNNYPPGLQTLCMNCQWVKRAENNETNSLSRKADAEMNIYYKWCNRRSECNYCHEPIVVDTVVAIHSWKNRKGWTQGKFYHPQCLGEHFEYKIRMEIPKPIRSNRGRPSLGLNTEEKRERATMLRANKRREKSADYCSRGA